jgi:hypothetical protein
VVEARPDRRVAVAEVGDHLLRAQMGWSPGERTFEARYNAVATPFNWKFTRRKLENLLQRVDTPDNPTHHHRQAA